MNDQPSYRAAYWISKDRQATVVLTDESQSWIADDALLAQAQALADDIGLEVGDGSIEIGQWKD